MLRVTVLLGTMNNNSKVVIYRTLQNLKIYIDTVEYMYSLEGKKGTLE